MSLSFAGSSLRGYPTSLSFAGSSLHGRLTQHLPQVLSCLIRELVVTEIQRLNSVIGLEKETVQREVIFVFFVTANTLS